MNNVITKNKYLTVALISFTSLVSYAQQTTVPMKKMKREHFDKTEWSYSQSVKISDYSEILFISGQIPEKEDGSLPESFEDQCRQAWHNVLIQLNKAGFEINDLVKVTIFLSDRKYRAINAQVRQEILKDISPALTIIITGIYDEAWLLEIEAIAAR